MDKLLVVSDKYINTIVSCGTMFEVTGCREISKACTVLKNYQQGELVGLLVIMSKGFTLSHQTDLQKLLSLWKFNTGKVVLYCEEPDKLKLMENLLTNSFKDSSIPYYLLKSVKELTEDFVLHEMLIHFIDEDIYAEPKKINIDSMSSRVVNTTKSYEQDILSMMKNIVTETYEVPVSKQSIEDLISGTSSVESDKVILDINKVLDELKAKQEGTSDKVQTKDLDVQIGILELIRENRDSRIRSSVVRDYIVSVRESLIKKADSISVEDIRIHSDSILELKTQQLTIENEFKEILSESQRNIETANGMLNLSNFNQKVLLIKENKNSPVYKDVIKSVISLSMESMLSLESITPLVNDLMTSWNETLSKVGHKFSEYVSVRDKIDLENETTLRNLANSKSIKYEVKSSLAGKLIMVCGLTENCGATTTAMALLSSFNSPLFIDFRVASCHSEVWFKYTKFTPMDDFLDSNIEAIANKLKNEDIKAIIPQYVPLLTNKIEDLFRRVLMAVEKAESKYDGVVVLVDPSDLYSDPVLEYGPRLILVSSTNMYTYGKAKRTYNTLKKFKNIFIKYMFLIGTYEDIDKDREVSRMGIDFTEVQCRIVPFLPVDRFKSEGKNMFTERPVFSSYYKL